MADQFYNNRLALISDLSRKLVSLQSSTKRAGTLARTVKDTKEERDRLGFYFITKETTQDFIEELESMATVAGVSLTLNSLAINKDGKQPPSSYLKFNIRADGSFRNVYHFLALLESLPYKIKISAARVAKLDQSWFGEISFDLISYIDQ